MRLSAGEPAPGFDIQDVFKRTHRLDDCSGKLLMLAFFRYASCPLCNLRVHQLIQHYPELKASGLNLLAFFQSPPESIRQYVGRQDAPFPIIADPYRVLYSRYGVEVSWGGFIKGGLHLDALISAATKGFLPGRMEGAKHLIPADFLIGPNQVIDVAHYGRDIGDHLPLNDIRSWLTLNNKQ